MKQTLVIFTLGALIGSVLSPLAAFAARTAAPVLTGLFPSTQLAVNLPTPVLSLPNARGAGSIGAGSSLYFSVTALDGVGESLPSSAIGTTSVQSSALQLTWPPVAGAYSYRVYFSTTTPQALTQYFTSTTTATGVANPYYTFTSTSSPTYASTGVPTSNTAYVANLLANGNSWLNGGAFNVGTTTFATGLMQTISTTTATTSAMIGSKGQSGGRWIFVDSNASHTTCTELTTAGGAGAFKAVTCP